MKIVIKTEGPTGQDVGIFDGETGRSLADIGIYVKSIHMSAEDFHRATLEVSLDHLHLVCQGKATGDRKLARRLLEDIAETGEAEL